MVSKLDSQKRREIEVFIGGGSNFKIIVVGFLWGREDGFQWNQDLVCFGRNHKFCGMEHPHECSIVFQ